MPDKLEGIVHKLDIVTDKISDIGTKLEVHITKFDAHIVREEEYKNALSKNTDILQANTTSLQEHIQRTDLLETYVKKLDERLTPVELEGLRKKAVVDWWKGRIVFLGKLGAAIGAIGALAGIAKWLINSL